MTDLLMTIAITLGPPLAVIVYFRCKSKTISTFDHTVMAAKPGDMAQMNETSE